MLIFFTEGVTSSCAPSCGKFYNSLLTKDVKKRAALNKLEEAIQNTIHLVSETLVKAMPIGSLLVIRIVEIITISLLKSMCKGNQSDIC